MDTQKKDRCRHFRSEAEHIPEQSNKKYWKDGVSTTKPHFCIQTMNTIGPDSGLVGESYCTERRTCFERV